ncbi:hypothetical protein KC19_2G028400 [Ceratodon purpureus]|uniref:Uncharacterized protein n=1 Tax=Ceratodon purpureus TaxID=3225 RepID=A0A8T0IPI9_CERPU|nr:hypothetical protein KC19_2G028400 [Ceratodon purpureus]
MAAWRQLQKFKKKRTSSKHSEMEATFTSIWSQADLFCSNDGNKPRWHPTPDRDFLPRELANRYSSARIFRADPPPVQDSSTEIEDSLSEDQAAPAATLIPRSILEAEELADAIIDQLCDDMEAEVEQEQEPPATLDPHSDHLSLPDDIQSPRFLAAQSGIWSPFINF